MKTVLFALAVMLSLTTTADAQTIGVQFIGASNTSVGDIDYAAASLASVKGASELSLLPHEFNPNNPYAAATRFINQYVARGGKSTRVTIYLKWFDHVPNGNADAAQFWNAWGAARPSAPQKSIKDNYMARVNAMMSWIASVRGVGGSRIRFTCVPCLEDVCQSQTAFNNVLAAIDGRRIAYGAGAVAVRRSCLPQYATFRGNAGSLELHGTWTEVKGKLRSGDTYSNDGTDVTPAAFAKDASTAWSLGISSLFWRVSYNGTPRNLGNWPRRTVNPFTGAGRAAEIAALRTVLQGR